MALLNFTANFSVLASILDRIARALERLAGPEPDLEPAPKRKRGPEAIISYGDGDREWAKQHFRNLIHEQGHAPEREQALLNVALKRFDYERKNPGRMEEK